MSSRVQHLAARRRKLVEQSDALRAQIAASSGGLAQVLRVADFGVLAGRAMAHSPFTLAGVAAAVLLVRPKSAMRALSLAMTALSVYAQLRRLFGARKRGERRSVISDQ